MRLATSRRARDGGHGSSLIAFAVSPSRKARAYARVRTRTGASSRRGRSRARSAAGMMHGKLAKALAQQRSSR